jgi:hypothetical protein
LLLLAGLVGCRSIESTFIDREPTTNQVVQTELDGYPITLKVPTHIRITLYENKFLHQPGLQKGQSALQSGDKTGWAVIKVDGKPLKSVSYGLLMIDTEKVFLVDHKRPAAGQLKYEVDFTDDQYIDELSSAATEDTIRQASIAASRAIDLLQGANLQDRTNAEATRTLSGSNASFTATSGATNKKRPDREEQFVGTVDLASDATHTKAISSVLASQVFEVDDPEFELKVSCFLQDSLPYLPR